MYSNLRALTKSHPAIRILVAFQQTGFVSAILAGGCIRDTYHEKKISDYDIFLRWPYATNNNEWNAALLPDVNKTPIISKTYIKTVIAGISHDIETITEMDSKHDVSYSSKHTRIISVWNLTSVADVKYQLIFVEQDPVEYVNTHFDLGICKAYCDGRKVHLTEDFMTDSLNETITICGKKMNKNEFDYVVYHHLDRIKQKYPGWKVVVAPQNMIFVDEDNKYML